MDRRGFVRSVLAVPLVGVLPSLAAALAPVSLHPLFQKQLEMCRAKTGGRKGYDLFYVIEVPTHKDAEGIENWKLVIHSWYWYPGANAPPGLKESTLPTLPGAGYGGKNRFPRFRCDNEAALDAHHGASYVKQAEHRGMTPEEFLADRWRKYKELSGNWGSYDLGAARREFERIRQHMGLAESAVVLV